MIEQVLPSLAAIFSLNCFAFLLLGILLGMLFGLLPGLGSAQAMALMIPVSFTLEPNLAVLLMIGALGSSTAAGSVTSILLNTPGTPGNTTTCFDGYPLTKQGKAGMALGAAATSSLLGGIFGTIVLILMLPLGKYVVLAFSFPDYFMLGVMSLSIIAIVSEGSMWKGLVSGAFGLMLASVGYDPVTGSVRYAFGIPYLYDGVSLFAVVIGLFAITETLELMSQNKTQINVPDEGIKGIKAGITSVFKNYGLFFRSSIVGTIIGILPGVGGSVANFLAYGQAVQTAKNKENFGKGDIRGVIAPEASNNAKDAGALVPTLIFGIPGAVDAAILLGGLIIHGIQPGPFLIQKNPGIIVLLILGLVVANAISCIAILLLAKPLSKVSMVRKSFIVPIISVFALLGTYVTRGVVFDVYLTIIFGLLGFTMKRAGFSRVAFVIAFVLSNLIQTNYHLAMKSFGIAGFVTRPISLTLIILMVVIFLAPHVQRKWKRVKFDEKQSSL